MTNVEDWDTRRKRYDAFGETELGKLFHAYERALLAYWQDDGTNDLKLIQLDDIAKTATHNFITKLMELAGV